MLNVCNGLTNMLNAQYTIPPYPNRNNTRIRGGEAEFVCENKIYCGNIVQRMTDGMRTECILHAITAVAISRVAQNDTLY